MPFETDQEKLVIGKDLEREAAILMEAINFHQDRPINFENLYTGDTLKAIAPYGGLATILDAFRRLRRFVSEFAKKTREEGVHRISDETLQCARKSLEILQEAGDGKSTSSLDKKAAAIIADDLLGKAKVLKAEGLVDADTEIVFNALFHEIRQLLDSGKMGGEQPKYFEDRFPLAFTMKKVEEIESALERASIRRRDSEILRAHGLGQRQVRIRKKK